MLKLISTSQMKISAPHPHQVPQAANYFSYNKSWLRMVEVSATIVS